MRFRFRNTARGFSLIEIIVGMLISAVAVFAISSIDQMMSKGTREITARNEWNEHVALINKLLANQRTCSLSITAGGADGKALPFDLASPVPWVQMPMREQPGALPANFLAKSQDNDNPNPLVTITAMFYQITPANVHGNTLVDPANPAIHYRYYPALLYVAAAKSKLLHKIVGGSRPYHHAVIPLNIITSVPNEADPSQDQVIGCVGNFIPQISVIKSLPTSGVTVSTTKGDCDPKSINVTDGYNPSGCLKPCIQTSGQPGFQAGGSCQPWQ